MSSFSRPIANFLAPNLEKDDTLLAFKVIFQPWIWKEGKFIYEFEKIFNDYFRFVDAISFNSGRAALFAILNSLSIKKNDEILIQAFTCNSLVNPILWQQTKPVFVDIVGVNNNGFLDLNLDPIDLEKKITKNSKAVIVQHTFGQPADIEKIQEICKKYNLFLIEDCAHSLGVKYKGKLLGTFGDASFFSFGRDKIISSTFGGMAGSINSLLASKIRKFQKDLNYPSYFWIFQQLFHPIIFSLILPTYNSGFGKFLLYFFQKIKLLSKGTSSEEKQGRKPNFFPKRFPNALAILAKNQFLKLEKFNRRRQENTKFYFENLPDNFILPTEREDIQFLKMFPILVENQKEILSESKKYGIIFDDQWYQSPIMPPGTDLSKMQYRMGSCRKAEKVASKIINLPTNPAVSKNDLDRVLNFIIKYAKPIES